MTKKTKNHYDVYIERYDNGWIVGSDKTYSLQWCFTKSGAERAARKWEQKLNNPKSKDRQYLKDMK